MMSIFRCTWRIIPGLCVGLIIGTALSHWLPPLFNQPSRARHIMARQPIEFYIGALTPCTDTPVARLVVLDKGTMEMWRFTTMPPISVGDNDRVAITRSGEEWIFDVQTRTLERTAVPLKDK